MIVSGFLRRSTFVYFCREINRLYRHCRHVRTAGHRGVPCTLRRTFITAISQTVRSRSTTDLAFTQINPTKKKLFSRSVLFLTQKLVYSFTTDRFSFDWRTSRWYFCPKSLPLFIHPYRIHCIYRVPASCFRLIIMLLKGIWLFWLQLYIRCESF